MAYKAGRGWSLRLRGGQRQEPWLARRAKAGAFVYEAGKGWSLGLRGGQRLEPSLTRQAEAGQRPISARMLLQPAWEPEFEDAFPKVSCGFSVLPAEIRNRQFDVEILNVRDPRRGADYQGTFAKISWIAPQENAGSCLEHEESYQQVDAAEDRISGFLL